MQVLLIKDIDRVGKKGETKRVTEGYARNFLFPRHLAVPLTEGSKKNLKLVEVSWKRQEEKEREAFQAMAKKIDGLALRITKKAGEKGRLFGSVTNAEIAEAIAAETKVEVDKKNILADHIKELGQHEVTVRFSGEVKATVKVIVLPEEESAAPATQA
ncbi:MAG: LSU ribosomal protein L9p [Candidatus Ozemobacter sibiricus]|jgi:large subunit ribosomal protein L9|uniref:Large ribosomal subunit protein bL9 n=1 Tax=Candidatus Ozemobacter sibiricus TaxID=2268124 RepID=A0A367ZNL7_9BACT|nr:MAG: LSU ribosomal protein L9p [Candidatus Ozemobacter sibiricus]